MRKPEILAPAGNLEKLKIAIDFGADAVYLGGGKLNLRAFSNNFTNEEMAEGIKYCHDRDKKVYVTLNVFARNPDLKGAGEYIKSLYDLGVDAIIVADPSLIAIAKEAAPDLELHLSTQANTVNWVATKFWHDLGVKRVVLARELTFNEIRTITSNIPEDCDIEAFVHGSMCIAYSGRCLISNYMLGRDSNKGVCSNACRYKYHLMEETRPGEYYPVVEDENGTYIMNSKDLCMINYIPELVQSGIYSFKIEGRMKSEFYVASVVKAYREALDAYWEDPENYKFKEEWMDTLNKISHRKYHTGFFLGKMGEQNYEESSYVRDYDIVGMVKSYDPETKIATILQKNRVFENDEVEVLRPHIPYFNVKLLDMFDAEKNVKTDVANRAHMTFTVKVDEPLQENDMLVKSNKVLSL
ncbi:MULTISPECIES: U32 family peptidase [Clostridium]|uniref:Peptidase U32 n=1 Tax=Clostridium botulinum (strain Eklund 17B / Type B) TaxID=935198 RepID=B2THN9_CLOBB|nr:MULTISPECIES: U32 family peptidase [Clostridium]ACD23889.1 peptidase U32 [Clostridium botulinum B str. Eklund 17B (NRP)]MBN1051535.1 U32 family peptidase [Clostridium botulinum]MBN1054763.1 U32 family peptidase [Clostridium botulinum]MBY6974995.1 U32 family peptidase [Clostridium botulinum]MBY6999975.1 U32 family peptidase [Clostridium botulinum]